MREGLRLADDNPHAEVPENWQIAKVVLKPVCVSCQERLNAVFEIPAINLLKAILIPELPISLTPRDQVVLAGWFVKTALVVSLARTIRDKPDSRTAERWIALRRMMETGVPPADVVLRLAYMPPPTQPTNRPLHPARLQEAYRPGYSVLIHLFFTVAEVNGALADTDLTSFVRDAENDDRFLVIWPPHITNARWPTTPLSQADIQTLRDSWGFPPEHHHDIGPPVRWRTQTAE